MKNICMTLDGRIFSKFTKLLEEFQVTVLNNENHEITPQSFLPFLDKLEKMTHSDRINDILITKIGQCDLSKLTINSLLITYQENQGDQLIEETQRMAEIEKFA